MTEIQYLEWDSNFFGYNVGKVYLGKNESENDIEINRSNFKLIYLFSESELSEKLVKKINAKLVDTKIEFIKTARSFDNDAKSRFEIKRLNEVTDDLLHLVYESGVYSRFKLDKNFTNNEFERLYFAWINKALTDNNSEVFGVYLHNIIIGFISLGLKDGIADIGLIAVHENSRGLNIGTKLLEEANNFAIKNKSELLTVVTQEGNNQAMRFYERNEFKVYKKNYIYHLWKNTQ